MESKKGCWSQYLEANKRRQSFEDSSHPYRKKVRHILTILINDGLKFKIPLRKVVLHHA